LCFTTTREYGHTGPEVSAGRTIHGNEHWEFDENGLMKRHDASIYNYKIDEPERRYRWERPGEGWA
jgi:uncharacterized protein